MVNKIIKCTYCGEKIETKAFYTEDAEPAHEKCLKAFEKYWEDKAEDIDIIGY